MTDFTFTESAPYEDYNGVDAQTVNAVDIFALTDKGAAFVTTEYRPWYNGQRLGTDSQIRNISAREEKERFCQSDGKYYLSYNCLSDSFHNPLDFLAHVEKNRYTFEREFRNFPMFAASKRADSIPFFRFHGNLKFLSAAFLYVIYDEGILTAVIEVANRILARDGKIGWEHRDGEVRRATNG